MQKLLKRAARRAWRYRGSLRRRLFDEGQFAARTCGEVDTGRSCACRGDGRSMRSSVSQPRVDEELQADQQRIAGKGGEARSRASCRSRWD